MPKNKRKNMPKTFTDVSHASESKTSPPETSCEEKIEIKEEPNDVVQNINKWEDREEKIYTVEHVLKKRKIGKKSYYFLKWKGYDNKHNTWEPAENVEHLDLIKFYEEQQKNISYNDTVYAKRNNAKKSYFDAIGSIWEVEKVVKKRMKNGEIEYFLKWKGELEDYNSWEPRKMVKNSEAVKAFEIQEKNNIKEKERNRLFHKLGEQVYDEYCLKKEKPAPLPKLVEDPAARQYYDCVTFLPITDASKSTKSTWLKSAWLKKMDKDKDLSTDEKQFAMLWNDFIINNRTTFRGNCHMKQALHKFVLENGENITKGKLRACYINHIGIMKDLGVLDTNEAMEYIMLLNGMV